jgi:hypothetical protein
VPLGQRKRIHPQGGASLNLEQPALLTFDDQQPDTVLLQTCIQLVSQIPNEVRVRT